MALPYLIPCLCGTQGLSETERVTLDRLIDRGSTQAGVLAYDVIESTLCPLHALSLYLSIYLSLSLSLSVCLSVCLIDIIIMISHFALLFVFPSFLV